MGVGGHVRRTGESGREGVPTGEGDGDWARREGLRRADSSYARHVPRIGARGGDRDKPRENQTFPQCEFFAEIFGSEIAASKLGTSARLRDSYNERSRFVHRLTSAHEFLPIFFWFSAVIF